VPQRDILDHRADLRVLRSALLRVPGPRSSSSAYPWEWS